MDATTVPEQPGWYADAEGAWWWWDGLSWTSARVAVAAGVGRAPRPGADPAAERTQALLVWGLSLVTWIGPLVLYFGAKDRPFVRHHAAEALNLALVGLVLSFPFALVSVAILFVGLAASESGGSSGGVVALVVIGVLTLASVGYSVGISVVGLVRAHRGIWWRAPLPFRWVPGAARPGEEPYSVRP
ncbi:MAG TPA: DUF4870 domain-containing protein [Acidimicrobiales bacterium]|nr:DUF4870 domain-containing protein [Acidimicrobiales bacterium]